RGCRNFVGKLAWSSHGPHGAPVISPIRKRTSVPVPSRSWGPKKWTPGRDLLMDRKRFLFPSHRGRSDRVTRDQRPRWDALELRTVLSAAELNFVPLPGSVALGSLPESAPFALPPGFTQEVVQSRFLDPDLLATNDMNTLNETDPDAGRYLFTA